MSKFLFTRISWNRDKLRKLWPLLKGEVSWGFWPLLLKIVKLDLRWATKWFLNNEGKEINSILERNNSWSVLAHFGKQKCVNLKNISLTFFKFRSIPTLFCLRPEALIGSFIALGFHCSMNKHVQPSINKLELLLTPACLPTCCCLATFPLSYVIQTSFALLPGNSTDTFNDIYINIFFARIRAA